MLRKNSGHCPPDAKVFSESGELLSFRRVRVVLFCGFDTAKTQPGGWASGGRGECNWRINMPPHPYDIKEYEIL